MKFILSTVFVLFLWTMAEAQSGKGYVHLKNGSVLKGRYSYSDDKQKLRVESAGNLWIFDAAEVVEITGKCPSKPEPEFTTDSKFIYQMELGVLAGSSENSQTAPFSFSASVNRPFQNRWMAGLGLGVEFLKETYTPVFAQAQYRLKNRGSAPYLFLRTGYMFPTGDANPVYYDVYPLWMSYYPFPQNLNEKLDAKGGILIHPGIGYRQMLSAHFGLSFAAGYQFHRLSYDADDDYSLHINYNRLTLKLGIIFD